MTANISCEYEQYFRLAVVRVTCKFQDIQNLIHPARKVAVSTLAEHRMLFEVWAANAGLLYSSSNRSGCSGPGGLNERARRALYEAKERLEGLEATISSEIAQLKHMDVAGSPKYPSAATQYKAVLRNAMDNIKTSMDSLGNSRSIRDRGVESSTTRRRQRTRPRQING